MCSPSENAAVNDMVLTVADRVIKGQIKKREEAKQLYEEGAGQTAALLDEERPISSPIGGQYPPAIDKGYPYLYTEPMYDHGVTSSISR